MADQKKLETKQLTAICPGHVTTLVEWCHRCRGQAIHTLEARQTLRAAEKALLTTMKMEGWLATKDEKGLWAPTCPICLEQLRRGGT